MTLAGKKVLIAGGAGFLGTNLALRLAGSGAQLRLTAHLRPLQANIPGAEIVQADLRRPEDCAQAVKGMDAVFICSAHTSGVVGDVASLPSLCASTDGVG